MLQRRAFLHSPPPPAHSPACLLPSATHAHRWFYEALVLRNNDFVELEQAEAYGDISIIARPKIAAGEEPSAC